MEQSNKDKKKRPGSSQIQWYDPSDWGYKPSQDFKLTLRIIPIVLVVIIGFTLGIARSTNSGTFTQRQLSDHGGEQKAALEKAYSLYISGDNVGALSLANAIIEEDPENAMAHQIIGLTFAKRGLLEEAARHLQMATTIDPEFALAWYNLGIIEESRGEFTKSLESYRKAVDLEPGSSKFSDAHNRVNKIVTGDGGLEWEHSETERLFSEGLAAINRGGPADLEFAENTFNALLNDRPYDVATRNMLGLTYARMGKLDRAEELFLQVVTAEPGFSDGWYNLGIVHRSQGRLDEALSDFETAMASSSLESFIEIAQQKIDEIRIMIESGSS